MILWDPVKDDFAWDGSLRDIYIAPAKADDWASIWPMLREYPGAEFSYEGNNEAPPATVQEVFASRASGNPMLRLRAGSVSIVFHFFSTEEIECDMDPRDITYQPDLDALLGFIRQLADRTGMRLLRKNGYELT
jgi:hypothetical protein